MNKAALLTSALAAHTLRVRDCVRARMCVSVCAYTGRGLVINHCLRADIRQPVNVN